MSAEPSVAPSTPAGGASGAPGAAPARVRLRWWREVLFVLVFYGLYSGVRNVRGSKPVSAAQAFTNARRVISLERGLGLYQEVHLQRLFVHDRALIAFWDVFYGTAHFVVTVAALVWLFRRQAWRYPLWRNTLACTTALALVGFAFFPLMPPRLLPATYHFTDTLRTVGGLWSFDSGAMNRVSNQFAAMPSLHFAWSTWCALVVAPACRRRRTRVAVFAYPALTLFCIVVTANHYLADAAGGATVLLAGYLVGRQITWLTGRWSGRRPLRLVPPGTPA